MCRKAKYLPRVEWLNYHHLQYFWRVVREGGVAPAGAALLLSPSTVSKQIHQLERSLGHALFTRVGRRLTLTESGRVAYRYAEEVFSLGREMQTVLAGGAGNRPARLAVGIADVVPKLLARRALQNADAGGRAVHLVCREDKPERLLAGLALHELDVILTDAPAPPQANVAAWSHLLGEYDVSFFAAPPLAARLRPRFPRSLENASVLLPTANTVLRRALDQWLHDEGIHPAVAGEFEDSALLMAFGEQGAGAFPAPTPIARELERQYGVRRIGKVPGVRERLYAVSVERRLAHPAVVAICDAARATLASPGRRAAPR
jgi:LysR family transcriptional regulator, transcriptional activator of nhaA